MKGKKEMKVEKWGYKNQNRKGIENLMKSLGKKKNTKIKNA